MMNTNYMELTDEVYAALGETTPHRRAAFRAELFRLGLAWRTRESKCAPIFVPRDLVDRLAKMKCVAAAEPRVPRKNHVTA